MCILRDDIQKVIGSVVLRRLMIYICKYIIHKRLLVLWDRGANAHVILHRSPLFILFLLSGGPIYFNFVKMLAPG